MTDNHRPDAGERPEAKSTSTTTAPPPRVRTALKNRDEESGQRGGSHALPAQSARVTFQTRAGTYLWHEHLVYWHLHL